ncbi:CGL79 [Auxenochlorella protothecoides x Auxenochlorella symbiontica]
MVGTKVVLFGDPIVDIVAHVPASVLDDIDAEPGGCSLVSSEELEGLLSIPSVQATARRALGGSAANVAKTLAVLSGDGDTSVCFCGMVGEDAEAQLVSSGLKEYDVLPALLSTPQPTAACLCLVTPDGQRTMRTCLAAAAQLQDPALVPAGLLEGARLVHCEGYCLYRGGFAEGVLRAARRAGALASLDLASLELVRGAWPAILRILEAGLADIVFCNEQEAAVVYEMAQLGGDTVADHSDPLQAVLAFLSGRCRLAVVSLGEDGCMMRARSGDEARGRARPRQVADTVGAGDAFTAGVLWGVLGGHSLAGAALAGCEAGGVAVEAAGAEPGVAALMALRASLAGLLPERGSTGRCALDVLSEQ